MQVSAFYSEWRGLALEEVWHDNDECFIAKSIPPAHRKVGTGTADRRHCRYCLLLNEPVAPPAPVAGPRKSMASANNNDMSSIH